VCVCVCINKPKISKSQQAECGGCDAFQGYGREEDLWRLDGDVGMLDGDVGMLDGDVGMLDGDGDGQLSVRFMSLLSSRPLTSLVSQVQRKGQCGHSERA